MKYLVSLFVVCYLSQISSGLTVKELHDAYWQVFPKTYNRNSASHLWSTYVINKVWGTHTKEQIYNLFAGFCPISGSIVRPSRYSKWNDLQLQSIFGGSMKASVNVCCWPCICDLQQFVKVDNVWIYTKNGWHSFLALVIGDPCINPEKIPKAASELTCTNGVLKGASKSAHGHIIIGLVQSNETPAANTATSKQQQCDNRKKNGYKWGMGKIFVEIASINPIA